MTRDSDWTKPEERGNLTFFQLLLDLHDRNLIQPWMVKLLRYPIITYFFLTDRARRSNSRNYFDHLYSSEKGRNALGHEPSWWDTYKHFLEFGRCTFDRFALWLGYRDRYTIERKGADVFYSSLESDQGAILLSFHVGNFDLMRYLAVERDVTVNVIAYWDNSPNVNRLLEQIEPSTYLNIIEVDPSEPASMLELQKCINRGEFIAILGDRKSVGASSRTVPVSFLGEQTRLPKGPYILSHVLDCPLLLTYTIRTGPDTYRIHVKRFAKRIELDRNNREEQIQHHAQKYARILEEVCYHVPYQWFNFFDFWNE